MKPLLEIKEWQDLLNHYPTLASQSMLTWFEQDPGRATRFSLEIGDILLDYSKNRVTDETFSLFNKLGGALNLQGKIQQLFNGTPLNFTEQRAALHTALRHFKTDPVYVNHSDVMPDIIATWARMKAFSDKIRKGQWLGSTGKPIKHIVNVGIGGSNLGPLMTTHALSEFAQDDLSCQFVSKIDGTDIHTLFKQIDPETTLFIISSKTFTTIETLTNAKTIRKWMADKLGHNSLTAHFVAVTAAADKALQFGIPLEQIFPLWDWVGGRYSVWSAIGLPLVIMIGMENFLAFLQGAHAMDNHFRESPLLSNMPIILAFLGVWYINFFHARSHALIPYSEHLNFLPDFLQQLDMESNGKGVSYHGAATPYSTGPIIWGNHGSDGQHAFLQLIHQSPHLIPVDFIIVGQPAHTLFEHQDILIASALSQAEALLRGKSYEQAYGELLNQGHSEQTAKMLAVHKVLPGNRPSNTLFIKKMTPFNLGALLALYEHKIFVQGCIWEINSFDQWGVELGKQLLPRILQDLTHSETELSHDSSTINLINYYKNLRKEIC